MKNVLLAVVVLTIALSGVAVLGVCDEPKKADEKDKASIWMKSKLHLSQNILEGLTRGDFEMISKNAKALNYLGYLEKWARANQEDYQRELKYFEAANKELIRQADNKSLAGTTLTHALLTGTCVRCHQIVRDAKK
ncbi:MAG TPA: hypothetical protein VK395_06125 [Gemmataceae bacterium]|nr:hypothetical protein [Gemmataceae bacterium]